jgi:hypothetical protein
VVTDRAERQKAIDGMSLSEIKLLQLGIVPTHEMMDMQILIAFAFRKPEHGSFKSRDITNGGTADLPIGPQRLPRLITRIESAQLDA